jgi:hypothetical protein
VTSIKEALMTKVTNPKPYDLEERTRDYPRARSVKTELLILIDKDWSIDT